MVLDFLSDFGYTSCGVELRRKKGMHPMKKYLYILCAAILIMAAFCACADRPGSSGSSASLVPTAPSQSAAPQSSAPAAIHSPRQYTAAEAAVNNAAINDSDIRLIQFEQPRADAPVAVMETSAGRITMVLYPEQAPKAVENFITHSKNGYYNGLGFSRVIRDFIIQGGAPNDGEPQSVFGGPFESEYSLDLWSFRGALVMVNSGAHRPDTNLSEFFIVSASYVSGSVLEMMQEAGYPQKVLEKYAEVGGIPGFDWRNTVFGMVIEGMDIVDQIAAGKTDAINNPLETVIISSITIRG